MCNCSESDKPPYSFLVLRIASKPPCLLLRLAFLGGTPGKQRKEVNIQLIVRHTFIFSSICLYWCKHGKMVPRLYVSWRTKYPGWTFRSAWLRRKIRSACGKRRVTTRGWWTRVTAPRCSGCGLTSAAAYSCRSPWRRYSSDTSACPRYKTGLVSMSCIGI